MDRVMNFVEFSRKGFYIIVGIIGLLGVGSYFRLKKLAQAIVSAKVNAWLQVTDRSSPLHEPLAKVRNGTARWPMPAPPCYLPFPKE
jgi:hypothetical protein